MAAKPKQATTGPKLWVVLARAYGSLASYVEHSVAKEGICLSDFMVLEVLLHKGAMTISAIGEKVLLAAPSMTSAIDRLEKLGYVVRKSSNEDRRIRLVEITAEGRRFAAALYERHSRQIDSIAAVLTQTEKDQLCELLKRLGKAAAAQEADSRTIEQ
jgi:MarR family 2-MHQ and catechol resistance regulon transcriptional repressor